MLALRRPVFPVLAPRRQQHLARVAASPVSLEIMKSFDLMDAATCCLLVCCGASMVVVDLAYQSAWKERERLGYRSDSDDDDM